MAKAAVNGVKGGAVTHPDTTFATLASMSDGLQLSPTAVEGRVEPYELVELFYGSSGGGTPTPPTSHVHEVSPQHSNGTSSPEVMQVIHPRLDLEKAAAAIGQYTCGVCGRSFKEASHYTKHKRGALCRKLAQRMAKKNKKKKSNKNDWPDRMRQAAPQKPYECTVCGAKFFDRGNVELHLERRHHTQQKLWAMVVPGGGCCTECDRWFPDRNELEQHQRQHHPAYLRSAQPTTSTTSIATVTTTAADAAAATGVVYYPEPLQQVVPYPSQPPPAPHIAPQPPQPPPQPQPQPHPQPTVQAHMQANIPTNLLHSAHLTSPPPLLPLSPAPTLPPPPPAPAHPPIASLPAPAAGDGAGKALRGGRGPRPGSAKWNMCGDCGHRFVDPINLELHLQRHHPTSCLLDTVTITGNTVLYRTDHTRSDLHAVALAAQASLPTNQSYECLLCGYRAAIHSHLTSHLQTVHGSANANLIHAVDTPEPTRKTGRTSQSRRGSKDTHGGRQVCEACGEVFPLRVELIRHRVKEKKYRCGVCCLASCSQEQVTAHMAAHHPGTPTTPTGLVCWLCGVSLYSAATLDSHLKGHGALGTECVECGERRPGLVELLPHLKAHLPLQPSRVRLSLAQAGQPTSTHEVEVALDSSVYSCTSHERAPATWAALAYACSECGACLPGAAQLEAHLQVHQINTSTHPSTSTHSLTTATTTCAATTATATCAATTAPGPPCLTGAGVSRVPGSLEFRCEECGFWRQDGEPVMKHIQAVHMSGNMLHSVRLPSGLLQVHPIQVVTPISTLVAQ